MNTASILIKTDPLIKAKAQKTAEKMGLSLTSIINHYLKHFINTETITFDAKEERLSKWAINALKESEADVKAGRIIRFKSVDNARAYVNSLIENDKSSK